VNTPLEKVLARLYASEINCAISFAAAELLTQHARVHFPDSQFSRELPWDCRPHAAVGHG
jgi:hypothetical protein